MGEPTRWGAALTLEERVRDGLPDGAGVGTGVRGSDDAAEEAVEYWRRSCGDTERLALRLRHAGLGEDGLRELIRVALSPAEDDATGADSGWVEHLRVLYADAPATPPAAAAPGLEGLARQSRRVTAPVTGWAAGRLAAAAAAAGSPVAVSLASALVPHVVDELADLVYQVVEQATGGDASAPAPDGWELMAAHPALARHVHRRAASVVEAGIELIERLVGDADALAEQSWSPAAGSIVDQAVVTGDSHAGARRTTVLTFSDGTRLVYKPRSHQLEEKVLALLGWLDDHGASDPLRLPRLVARPEHAWVEHIEAGTCTTDVEVRRYFRRLGAWMAVLHALGGTDVHAENLIACGDAPVPIDLECLFATAARPAVETGLEADHGETREPAPDGRGVGLSVLSQHVLRVRQSPTMPIDTSAVGAGLDEDAAEGEEAAAQPPGPNLVTLRGRAVQPAAYADSVAAGFAETHTVLGEHRAELAAPGGAVAAFLGCEVRFLLRPTDVYARLLRAANHPAAAGDGLERDAVLGGLWRAAQHRPELEGTIAAELVDLRDGDVPRFTAIVGSDHLRDARGATYPQVDGTRLLDPGTCLERLDAGDRARQLAVIATSLRAMDPRASWPSHRSAATDRRRPPSRRELLDTAGAIARRVERLAFTTATGPEWPVLVRWQDRDVVDTGRDLGAGSIGIALFLAAAGRVLGWDDGTASARATLDAFLRVDDAGVAEDASLDPALPPGRRSTARPAVDEVGLERGAGGVLWGVLAIGSLLGDEPAVLDLLERRLPPLRRLAEEASGFDVATGIGGMVPVLVELAAARPDSDAAGVLSVVAERLARPHGALPGPGFGRGRAGLSVMLLAAATRLGRDDLAAVAIKALRSAAGEPPADASASGGTAAPGGWRAGPVGTGLALAAASAISPAAAPSLEDALDDAVRAALADGLGHDHSLVTGDLGVAELLRAAAAVTGRHDLGVMADSIVADVVDDVGRHQPRCGHRAGIETAALLPGLSGIGYALLRGAGDPEADLLPRVLVPVDGVAGRS